MAGTTMNLPPRMKSGRELVAVNESRTAGLYGSLDEGYCVLMPDRTISLGDYAAGRSYPICPDGRWFWKHGQRPEPVIHKSKRRLRREEQDRQVAERTSIRPGSSHSSSERADPNACVDCETDVRKRGDSHWHESHPYTTPHGLKPGTVCCPCAEGRGYVCAEKARQRAQGGVGGDSKAEAGRKAIRGLARRRRALKGG